MGAFHRLNLIAAAHDQRVPEEEIAAGGVARALECAGMRPSTIVRSAVPGAAAVFAVALTIVGAGPGAAQTPQPGDADAGKELAAKLAARPADAERFVRDYLARNPRIAQEIEAAVKRRMRPQVEKRSAIRSSAAAFVAGKVPLGNPKGDVTLVEFVDFNCLPCRRALPMLMDLVKSDPGLKVVMIHHPILGPGSVEAARIAIALQMQDAGAEKYPAFHEKLLAGPGRADRARALAVAAELGLDVARLEADAAGPEVDKALDDTRKLARSLGLRGIPSYIVGDNLLPGGFDPAVFRTRIAVARRERADSLRHCDAAAPADLRIAACTNVLGRGDLGTEVLVKAYVNRCEAYVAKGRHERAMVDCNEAIELNPTAAGAFAGRSTVHAAKGSRKLALADLGEAIRLDPKAAEFYVRRGALYNAGNAYADAVVDFNTAIDVDPKSHVAYARRADTLRKMGQPDRAIRDYEQAIRLQPRFVEAHVRRAGTLRDLREYALAIKGYDRAIELRPKDASNYYLRGGARSDNGQLDRALADYTDALRLDPRLAVAWDARARTCLDLGKAAEGLPDADRAIQLKPDFAQGYDTRAHIYEALGRKEEAIADFRKALELMPTLQRSLEGLGRLGATH
jgi:tetratricopeptide (TPR) repeat protein